MKPCTQVPLHVQGMSIFCNAFTENSIRHIRAHCTVFQTQIRHAFRILTVLHTQTPTVVHVLSPRLGDPNKSPLYPSIQGLRAATPGWCLHLRKLPDHWPLSPRQPTYWTCFSIFSLLNSITNPPLSLHSLWTYICISFALAMVSPSLNAYLGIVMKYDLKPHLYVSCKNPFPYNTFVYLFIH